MPCNVLRNEALLFYFYWILALSRWYFNPGK